MRTLDRLSIYALSFAVVGLVIALLMQQSRKTGDTGEIAPNRDLFNMKEYSQRQNRFSKEIEIEERLGKK